MNKGADKNIEVWADGFDDGRPQKVGLLHSFITRGKETFSFEYDDDWLQGTCKLQLDPKLKLFKGAQFAPNDKPSFGIFLDSSPDRWGRTLMQRREPTRRFMESDYLLGVYDGHRMGGLRFKYADGLFLDDREENAIPPWASLRELEQACLYLEQADAQESPQFSHWLKLIVAPGSSLGGARPKASVVDTKGNLWIAKFPSRDDDKDVGAWEAVVHTLAKKCGLRVPVTQLKKFGNKHHTFLSQRFDRSSPQKRIHFASAMTMLERKDGDDASQGASYMEIVDFIIANGSRVGCDLEELWRRIVFFISVSNTDDHLRNHGFLLAPGGWQLAPAYDMNPVPFATGLSLNISETRNELDLALAMEVIPFFRLSSGKAKSIAKKIKKEVSDWRSVARHYGLPKHEQDSMTKCFRF
jgi:serine/threonine-protein kinase HipA